MDSSDKGTNLIQTNVLLYEDFTITNWVHNYTATGDVAYRACKGGHFKLKYGETFKERRGWCLIYQITATMTNDNEASAPIEAQPYYSSGTGFSIFQIVERGQLQFKVERIS